MLNCATFIYFRKNKKNLLSGKLGAEFYINIYSRRSSSSSSRRFTEKEDSVYVYMASSSQCSLCARSGSFDSIDVGIFSAIAESVFLQRQKFLYMYKYTLYAYIYIIYIFPV